MSRRFFSGRTLQAAVLSAASHYGIEPEELAYEEIDKRHGLLKSRSKVVIAVDPVDPRRPAAGAREAVTLEFRNLLVLYSSGLHTEDRAIACRWRCGTRPFAAPACRRLPRAHERG